MPTRDGRVRLRRKYCQIARNFGAVSAVKRDAAARNDRAANSHQSFVKLVRKKNFRAIALIIFRVLRGELRPIRDAIVFLHSLAMHSRRRTFPAARGRSWLAADDLTRQGEFRPHPGRIFTPRRHVPFPARAHTRTTIPFYRNRRRTDSARKRCPCPDIGGNRIDRRRVDSATTL